MKHDILNRKSVDIPERVLLLAGSLLAGVGCVGTLAIGTPAIAELAKLLVTGSVEKRIAFLTFVNSLSPVVFWPVVLITVPVLTMIVVTSRRLSRFRATYNELREWKNRFSDLKYSGF